MHVQPPKLTRTWPIYVYPLCSGFALTLSIAITVINIQATIASDFRWYLRPTYYGPDAVHSQIRAHTMSHTTWSCDARATTVLER